MSDYIPPELVSKILIHLPTKTLISCTIVCKTWYSLITSSSFTTSHLNFSLSKNPNRLFIRFCTEHRQIRVIDSYVKEHYKVFLDNPSFEEIAQLECPFTTLNWHFRVIAGFNGVYCLSDDNGCYLEKIYLWNPSLKKSICLPKSRVLFSTHGSYKHAIGFGFVASKNDYKVVRIVYLESRGGYETPPIVEIFELSTGKWRDLNDVDLSYVIFDPTTQGFLNGCVHWVGNKFEKIGGRSSRLIVSFDFNTEKFGSLMVPEILQSVWRLNVTIVRNSLCLIHKVSRRSHCLLWVMNEYGVPNSWSLLFHVDIGDSDFIQPNVFCRENGDILLGDSSGKSDVISYNPMTKQVSKLEKWESTRSIYIDTYMESLVLLKSLNEVLGYSGESQKCGSSS